MQVIKMINAPDSLPSFWIVSEILPLVLEGLTCNPLMAVQKSPSKSLKQDVFHIKSGGGGKR